jgi:PAS domain S-box-containing protein
MQPLVYCDQALAVIAASFQRGELSLETLALEKAAVDMGAALAFLVTHQRFRDAKRGYDALLRAAPMGICCLDREGRVTMWNSAAERIFGWPAGEIVGHPPAIAAAAQREIFQTCLQGALRGQSTARLELKGQSRSGRALDVAISMAPLLGSGGTGEGILVVIDDLTTRKQAERRLALQHDVTRTLADATSLQQGLHAVLLSICTQMSWSCGEYWSLDREGSGWCRSLSWNAPAPGAIEFEAGSRNAFPADPSDLAQHVLAADRPTMFARFVTDRSVERAALAARCGLSDAFGFPVSAGGEPAGAMLFFAGEIAEPDEPFLGWAASLAEQIGQFVERERTRDSLKQAEADLRQSEKMDTMGRLVGGVAHDFNNLLTVILGYGELLLEQTGADSPMREAISEVVDAGKRASGLTRQLLAFCRKEACNPVVLDLNVPVQEMEKMFRRLIGEAIELQTELAADLHHVLADPAQVEQVLMNLVVNARDAMPQGGRLTIQTRNVELTRAQLPPCGDLRPGAYVCLSVRDNGCGMDDATRLRIFEPFFTTKQAGRGTGMGLATVQEIVRQAGGHISVESRLGEGTVFECLFPRVTSGLAAWEIDSSPEAIPRGSETVLVVEDEGRVRRLISRVLKVQGYRVLEASNADEALGLCRQHASIDLLLTDVVMPDKNGPELAQEIGAIQPKIPVLFVSGYRDTELERLGVRGLSERFLQKPFTTLDLATKVRRILDEAQAAR